MSKGNSRVILERTIILSNEVHTHRNKDVYVPYQLTWQVPSCQSLYGHRIPILTIQCMQKALMQHQTELQNHTCTISQASSIHGKETQTEKQSLFNINPVPYWHSTIKASL